MSEKPSLEARAQIVKERRLDVITHTPSLVFVEFVDTTLKLAEWKVEPILLSSCGSGNNEEIIDWITGNFVSENIQSEYLLMFEDRKATIRSPAPPWAHVKLGSDYVWIEPLWNLGQGIYILSLDERYFLQIHYGRSRV